MINKPENRALRISELRVVSANGKRTLSGYAAVFNSPSEDLGGWIEYVAPNAFDRSLAENADVRCLVEHDPVRIVGRTKSGTLRITTDSRGLKFECDLPDTSVANDLITSIERGDLDACSFGFVAVKQEWTEDAQTGAVTRTLIDVDLLDTSVVAYPAYPATSVGVRSLPDSMPVEMRSRISRRSTQKTKSVDGHELTADCFLIVLDPNDINTWHLPWKFPTAAETVDHLRDALARFDQVEDVPDADLKAAKKKLLQLCKEHGIDTSESKSIRALTDQCTCPCPQCLAGSCGICSADPQCLGAERNSERSASWHADAMLKLRLAEAS
jgi:HK97 family phage prohead protease